MGIKKGKCKSTIQTTNAGIKALLPNWWNNNKANLHHQQIYQNGGHFPKTFLIRGSAVNHLYNKTLILPKRVAFEKFARNATKSNILLGA